MPLVSSASINCSNRGYAEIPDNGSRACCFNFSFSFQGNGLILPVVAVVDRPHAASPSAIASVAVLESIEWVLGKVGTLRRPRGHRLPLYGQQNPSCFGRVQPTLHSGACSRTPRSVDSCLLLIFRSQRLGRVPVAGRPAHSPYFQAY